MLSIILRIIDRESRGGEMNIMGGYLQRYARTSLDDDQEDMVISLPKLLVQQFRAYVEELNLSVSEAIQYLVEQELQDSPATASRPEKYRAFWKELVTEMGVKRTALPQSWLSFSSGHKGITYTLSFGKDGRIRIDMSVDTGDKAANHRVFEALRAMRRDIEQHFPRALSWEDNVHRRACRIALYRPGRIGDDNIEELRAWFIRGLELFQEVFSPLLGRVVT